MITTVLSSTLGLLWNKPGKFNHHEFEDGDIHAEERIREILRELDVNKTKLEAAPFKRGIKEILSSYSFVKEGVEFLNASVQNTKSTVQEYTRDKSYQDKDGGETSSTADFSILSEAQELSRAVSSLKMSSEFDFAKRQFNEASKLATNIFSNAAIRTTTRISAAKLRIVSEILACLENTEIGIANCISCLQELHSLPAVCEIVSVFLKGGIRSVLGRVKRAENVKAIMMINYALFTFASKFSLKYFSAFAWPVIQRSSARSFNPIRHWRELFTTQFSGEEFEPPRRQLMLDKEVHDSDFCTVNSCIDFISSFDEPSSEHNEGIKVINSVGKSKLIKPARFYLQLVNIAVDNNDNVYVVVESYDDYLDRCYYLWLFDNDFNMKNSCMLDFLGANIFERVKIAIKKNYDIVMIVENWGPGVFVCDNTGRLKYKFRAGDNLLHYVLSLTDNDEIVISSHDRKAVLVHTGEGELKSTVKLPKDHEVCAIAFHHVICQLVVVTFVEKTQSVYLVCYNSHDGKLDTPTFLCYYSDGSPYRYPWRSPINIVSHSSGPFAVVFGGKVTFI